MGQNGGIYLQRQPIVTVEEHESYVAGIFHLSKPELQISKLNLMMAQHILAQNV